jgi:transcriptional regulator GlxA family with amidase domain
MLHPASAARYRNFRVSASTAQNFDVPKLLRPVVFAECVGNFALVEITGLSLRRNTLRSLAVTFNAGQGKGQKGDRSIVALLHSDNSGRPSDRIRRALSYARAHLRETLSAEQLADVAGLSPPQFGRVFLSETGQTPAKAAERLRAESARANREDQ